MSYEQQTLEQYFEKYAVSDADKKMHLLSRITELIYDRNMHVVELEQETDPYKQAQIQEGIAELEDEIKRQFETV